MTRAMYTSLSRELQEFLSCEGVNLSPTEIQLRKHVLKSLDEIVTRWAVRVYESCRKQGSMPNIKEHHLVKMLPQGSYYLQTDDPTSDIDVIVVTSCCIRRRQHFFGHHQLALQTMLQSDDRAAEVVAISSASVPLLRFRFYGVDVDMGMCQLQHHEITDYLDYSSEDLIRNWVADEESRKTLGGWRSTIAIRDLWEGDPQSGRFRNYKFVVRLLKLWAKRRGLYSNVLGFFGGINISILVGRILQSNHMHIQPAEMVYKFFKMYDCEWQEIYGLYPFIGRNGQHVLEPTFSGSWQTHSMKIITPTLPQINSSSSVFPSSLTIIQQEIQRAKEICQSMLEGGPQAKNWKDLTEPLDFWRTYQQFLMIKITVSNKSHLAGWQGKVISKIRKLAIDLQHLVGLVRPWTFPVYEVADKEGEKGAVQKCDKCVMYFMSLEKNPENVNKGYFDNVIRNFRQATISEYQDERCHRNGMDLSISVVRQTELPYDCFAEANNMERINQHRLGDVEWAIRDAAITSINHSNTTRQQQQQQQQYHRGQKRWPYDRSSKDIAWIPCRQLAAGQQACDKQNNHHRSGAQDMAVAFQMMNKQALLNSIRSGNVQPTQEKQQSPLRAASTGGIPTSNPATLNKQDIKQLNNAAMSPFLLPKEIQRIVDVDSNSGYMDLQKLLSGTALPLQKEQVPPLRRTSSEVNSTMCNSKLLHESLLQSKMQQILDGRILRGNFNNQQHLRPSITQNKLAQGNGWKGGHQGIKVRVSGHNTIACRPHNSYADQGQGVVLEREALQQLSFSEHSFPLLQKQPTPPLPLLLQNNDAPDEKMDTASLSQDNSEKGGSPQVNLTYAQVMNKVSFLSAGSSLLTPSSTPECMLEDQSMISCQPTRSPSYWSDELIEHNPVIEMCGDDRLSRTSSDDINIKAVPQTQMHPYPFKNLDHYHPSSSLDASPEMDKVMVHDLLSILNRNHQADNNNNNNSNNNNDRNHEEEEVMTQAVSRSGSGSLHFSEVADRENSGIMMMLNGLGSSQESELEQLRMDGVGSGNEAQGSVREIRMSGGNGSPNIQPNKRRIVRVTTETEPIILSKSNPQHTLQFANIDELKQSILGSGDSATTLPPTNSSSPSLESALNSMESKNQSPSECIEALDDDQEQSQKEDQGQDQEVLMRTVLADQGCGDFNAFIGSVHALPARCYETYRSRRNGSNQVIEVIKDKTHCEKGEEDIEEVEVKSNKDSSGESPEIATVHTQPNKPITNTNIATLHTKKFNSAHKYRKYRRERKNTRYEKRYIRKHVGEDADEVTNSRSMRSAKPVTGPQKQYKE